MTDTHTHHFQPVPTGTYDAIGFPERIMQCACGERPADAALRRHAARTRSTNHQTVRPVTS